MGLAERKATKRVETEKLPKLQADINGATGFEVPLEINWLAIAIVLGTNSYSKYRSFLLITALP